MAKGLKNGDGNILPNKSGSGSVTPEQKRKILAKRKEKEEKKLQLKKGFSKYFEGCLERVQILLNNNHLSPEEYELPKLFFLSNICEKQRRNNLFEQHILERSYLSIVNSGDEKTHKEAVKDYNLIIERFK